jgi:hypothetical protein
MIRKLPEETVLQELHRIREEISDRFRGNIPAIADDAEKRLANSGRPIWKPRQDAPAPGETRDGS